MIDQLLISPLSTTIDYYATCINDKVHAFLSKHALCDDAALRVGFADRSLGKQLPTPRLKAGRLIREHLKQFGVLKPNGREVFRGHVTVPLTNATDETTGIYGLRLDVLPGQQRQTIIGSGLFNAAALQNYDEIIVCGSVIDAWTFYAAGHQNVIATEGVELQPEHFAGVKRVLLADATIDSAAFEGRELLRINFPEGISVNQFAIDSPSIAQAIGKRIRAASWIGGSSSQPASDQVAKEETTTTKAKRHEQKTAPTSSPVLSLKEELEADSDEHQTVVSARQSASCGPIGDRLAAFAPEFLATFATLGGLTLATADFVDLPLALRVRPEPNIRQQVVQFVAHDRLFSLALRERLAAPVAR